MKKLLYLFFAVAMGLVACNKEPQFPDPGLDSRRSLSDTVRRDTIDFYRFSMNIQTPNGLEKITLLDAYTYEVIADITGKYKGQTDFNFTHDFDLRSIVRDTTMKFIIKVLDQNSRSFNKAFSLTVYAFSFPQVTLIGERPIIGLVSPVFELKGTISTGLNNIADYKIYFDNVLIDQNDFTTAEPPVREYKYSKLTKLNMVKGQSYTLKFVISDNLGQVGTKEYTLKLVESKRPSIVSVWTQANVLTGRYELSYNKTTQKLDSVKYFFISKDINGVISEKKHKLVFEYNDMGLVTQLINTKFIADPKITMREMKIVYTYAEGTDKLLKITNSGASGATITPESWYPDNKVQNFFVGTSPTSVKNLAWAPDPMDANLPRVFGETFWTSQTLTTDGNRCFFKDMMPVVIPTYVPGLPPFSVFDTGSPDIEIIALFTNKYVWDTGWRGGTTYTKPFLKYSVQTDPSGQLTSFRRSVMSTTTGLEASAIVFKFVYED